LALKEQMEPKVLKGRMAHRAHKDSKVL
jgi:hypothetical protein